MNLFSAIALAISILCLILSLGIFRYAREKAHYLWAFFNLAVAAWAFGSFHVGNSTSSQEAILNWKLSYVSATFISVIFYHLVCVFCRVKKARTILFFYIQGALFFPIILFTNFFVASTNYIFDSIFYHKATPLFTIWLILWTTIVSSSFSELRKYIKRIDNGVERIQALFLFWAMMVGFVGGVSTAIPAYGFHFYPVWQASICLYVLILTYAIIKHNFLEFRIVLRSLIIPSLVCGIFVIILVYRILNLSIFALASISLGVACLMLAFLVFAYSNYPLHRIWSFFNLAVFSWAMGTFFAGIAKSPHHAEIGWRWAYGLGPFVPSIFYHFIYSFCELNKKNTLRAIYSLGILFIPINFFAPNFITDIEYIFGSIYYHKATLLFTIFMSYLGIVVFVSFKEIINYLKIAKGNKRTQALYILYGFGIGWGGGITTFLPSYGVPIYPAWHFTICIYTIIMTYAILRYQIMDIKIAVTRAGTFVLVYSIVLGIPFGLAIMGKPWLIGLLGEQWFWVPMLSLLTLATAGPFIYLFIQRKAENALLQEEKRTQDLLNRASKGMRTIRSLPKLSELIVDVLAKSLRLDNAAIYLHESMNNHYLLKVSQRECSVNVNIAKNDPLIRRLEETQYPVVYEEVKLLSDAEQNGNKVLREIAGQMAGLQASVVIPAMSDNFLLGFIVLGERKDKRLYSVDLINVLSVLGNQAALAIENCHYIQRMQAEGLAERMISLDHMASSMAHEIDNPMHIIRTSLSFVKSALLRDPRVAMPEEIKQDFDESLARSLNASERVSSMIKAILDYSRMGTGKLESIRVSDALEGFLQLIQPQIREERVQFTKEIENDLPPVLGDRVQMEEIFMNFVRNSLHAVRRNEEKKITLKIFRKNETIIRIECSDNGYGIPKEIINDIFLSSMTTKGSTEGTGLGLFRVRKIVDIFRGKVWAESEGKGKGATFIVELPVYEGNNADGKNK